MVRRYRWRWCRRCGGYKFECDQPEGYVVNFQDCDDEDDALNILDVDGDGATSCEDCDDEDVSSNLQDLDGDGFIPVQVIAMMVIIGSSGC